MSAEVLTSDEKLGLERIRRLSRLAGAPWLAFPLSFVLSVVALSLRRFSPGVTLALGALAVALAVGSVIVGIVSSIRYHAVRCPRCDQQFLQLPGSRFGFLWPTKACRKCGLSLKLLR